MEMTLKEVITKQDWSRIFKFTNKYILTNTSSLISRTKTRYKKPSELKFVASKNLLKYCCCAKVAQPDLSVAAHRLCDDSYKEGGAGVVTGHFVDVI